MSTFAELKSLADQRWRDLTSGEVIWVRVGTAMCGQAAGSIDVVEALNEELSARKINAVVDEVGCIGLCSAEPLVDITRDGVTRVFFNNVSVGDVPSLVSEYIEYGRDSGCNALAYLGGTGVADLQELSTLRSVSLQQRIALRNAGNIAPNDILQYIANGGYAGLNKALFSMEPQDVIKEITDSGLRGRGGAAFPTGVKWGFLVRSPGPPKYILCNCEEGDPGAYNDKGILESDPHTLLEGLIIAGYATGATKGFVFIRHGHEGPIERTEEAIQQAYNAGLLGRDILGSSFSFDVEISLTGDSYVAGEETAMMESIEGKRSMPRSRPPFPAMFGVWGKPTNINNVKTLSYAPEIVSRGSEWFSGIGVNRSKGTAIVCLSGDITYPGLYEVPMGTTLGRIINEVGGGVPEGKQLKLLQTGGPLGGVLGADSMDIHLDFEEMAEAGAILGSGGIIVADEDTCAVDFTRVLVAFCQYESCGKCFPCRLGMTHLLEFVERICRFEGRPDDLDLMKSVGETMQAGSLCGHGQLGFNPIRSALQAFSEEFKMHLEEGHCPAGVCPSVVTSPRNTRPFADDYDKANLAPIQMETASGN